ncbi:MAG: phosphotransferase [Alphaproteobacteria bacterium]
MSASSRGGVPRHPDDVTPQWLTARLREDGVLSSGAVTKVTAHKTNDWNMAASARVAIDYDDAANRQAPRSLFVKIMETADPYADFIPGEVAFYNEPLPDTLPLAQCYGAGRDPVAGVTHVLLEDLSATHGHSKWPLPPSLARCEAAVTALARIHGHWWKGDVSKSDEFGIDRRLKLERFAGHLPNLVAEFLAFVGEAAPLDRQEIVRSVCRRLPDLLDSRLFGGLPITRNHGDPHFWNIMFAKDPARHGCIFIDWEDWQYNPPAFDLAYMMALHWYPDHRARHEEHLLRTYHDALLREITTGYSWEQLMADYRLGHLHNFIVPLFQLNMGEPGEGWWPHVERLFLSYDDLDCGALL